MKGSPLIYVLAVVAIIFVIVRLRPGPQPPLQGEVLVDGQPVPVGEITFVPIEGTKGPPVSLPIINGKYSAAMDDVLGTGPHKVTVSIGNPIGGAPPQIESSSTFSALNGARFEHRIDTGAEDPQKFSIQLTSRDAILPAQGRDSVFESN